MGEKKTMMRSGPMTEKADELLERIARRVQGLFDQGKYEEAMPLALHGNDVARRIYGESDPRFAGSLNDTATLHTVMGDFKAAEPLMRKALEINREALGPYHPDVAEILTNLAELCGRMERYSEAETLLLEAQGIRSETFGEHPLGFALTMNNLAALYHRMGRYKEAEALFLRALEFRRAALGDEHVDVANCLSNLAATYHSLGRYRLSEQAHLRAVDTLRKVSGEEGLHFADALNNLASLYSSMGNFAAAQTLHRRVLKIRSQVLGESHPDFANSLNSLAGQYHVTGDYAKAEPLYRRALAIRRQALGEHHSDVAASLNNLASLYHSMGGNKKAEPLYRKALEIRRKTLGEHHPEYAQNLNNLAGLYESIEDYDRAESIHLQVLELRREALGEEHADFAQSLNNLAALYFLMEKYEAMETLLTRAAEIWRAALGPDHADVAQSTNNLAAFYYSTGDYAKAEPLYREALETGRRTKGEWHPDFATSLNNLAVVLVATGRAKEALELKKRAAAIEDRILGQVFSIAAESQRLAFLDVVRTSTEAFLSLVVRFLAANKDAVHSAFDLVQRRKAAGAQAVAAQRDAVLGGRYPELKEALKELAELRMQIAQRSLSGPGAEGLDTYVRELADLSADRDRIESDLVQKIPEMNIERRLRSAKRQTIAEALPEGSALIEFVKFDTFDFTAVPARGDQLWGPARYFAFVLRQKNPKDLKLIDVGDAEAIDDMIAEFRGSIGRERRRIPDAEEEMPRAAKRDPAVGLRETVFDPLLTALGNCKRLLLAPDGDLYRLPFEVLPLSGGRTLIDDFHITYLGVGRDVLRFVGPSARQQGAPPLVLAAPDYNLSAQTADPDAGLRGHQVQRRSRNIDPRKLYFRRLKGTQIEGTIVARMLGVEPWLGKRALEGPLKRYASPRILHLATHGFFLPVSKQESRQELHRRSGWFRGFNEMEATRLENPLLRSGLVLAGFNSWARGKPLPPEAEDGLLTAEDVSGMNLLDTELVVLSACETGLGDVQTGEGVFGLRRAFALAGTRGLVMSLWKVADEATRELMEEFYGRIVAGDERQSPGEALRGAQLFVKQQERFADPFYWGAFIYEGDPY